MTEDDAKSWIADRYYAPSVTLLERFSVLLMDENDRQNLIASSTTAMIWQRHILDSAQLLDHVPFDWHHWVDIGSGAGLPGMIVAILACRQVTLIEPRRLRAEFLRACVDELALDHVTVIPAKAERATVTAPVDVISARAVASLDAVFTGSGHFATAKTTYVLPKGERAKTEVADVRRSWQGMFHVEQSIVDPKSGIVVATGVARR